MIDHSKGLLRIVKIISGGQTGADRAGLDVALSLGIPHGGWCPRGRLAEDGMIPDCYVLQQTETSDYAVRTERNVLTSDATLIFTFGPARGGSAATIGFACRHHRCWRHVDLGLIQDDNAAVMQITQWLRNLPYQRLLWPEDSSHNKVEERLLLSTADSSTGGITLNIAGSRASGSPAIYPRVYNIVKELLQMRQTC